MCPFVVLTNRLTERGHNKDLLDQEFTKSKNLVRSNLLENKENM